MELPMVLLYQDQGNYRYFWWSIDIVDVIVESHGLIEDDTKDLCMARQGNVGLSDINAVLLIEEKLWCFWYTEQDGFFCFYQGGSKKTPDENSLIFLWLVKDFR